MFKTVIATAILGLGITGAYFLVQTPEIGNNAREVSGNNRITSGPFVEEVGDSAEIPSFLGENLTEKLIGQLGEDIRQNNPKISTLAGGKKAIAVPDVEALTDDLLGTAFDTFDPASIYPKISASDLNIIKNSDRASLEKYLSGLNIILAHENNLPAIPGLDSEEDFLKGISAGLLVYGKIFSDLRRLPVPEKLSELHKKELELIGAKINILKSMSFINEDPVTAIVMATYSNGVDSGLEKNMQEISLSIR